jgi:hypothetical protein
MLPRLMTFQSSDTITRNGTRDTTEVSLMLQPEVTRLTTLHFFPLSIMSRVGLVRVTYETGFGFNDWIY